MSEKGLKSVKSVDTLYSREMSTSSTSYCSEEIVDFLHPFFDPAKIFAHRKQIDELLNGKCVKPITVEVHLTNLCNHNCVWCFYRGFRFGEYSTISRKRMLSLVSDLIALQAKAVVISGGGEPLLHPDVEEVIERLGRSGIELGVITNGSMLNIDSLATKIAKFCRWIRISLDAGTTETHNMLHKPRVKDEFSIILENIKELNQLREQINPDLAIGISFLAHPLNVLDLPQLYSLCNSLSVDYLQVKPVLKLDKDKHEEILYLLRQMSSFIRHGKTELYTNFPRFNEIVRSEQRGYVDCLYSHFVTAIAADGNCYPCCQLVGNETFSFGNLNNSSLGDIWFGSKRSGVLTTIVTKFCPTCRGHQINEMLNGYRRGVISETDIKKSYKHSNFI
jgi:radical SAM protein with 4Fe4S-binding SPASM domain